MAKKENVVAEHPFEAIIYTDGGCKPSRGIGGWGVHGYVYHSVEPKQGTGCRLATMTNYGYVVAKEMPLMALDAGLKIIPITPVEYIDAFGSLIPESTNNEAELTALLEALRWIDERPQDKRLVSVRFLIDSKYVLDGIQHWVKNWERSGWTKSDGTEISNLTHWKEAHGLVCKLTEEGVSFKWRWVRGHSGDLGNENVDTKASKAIIAGNKGKSIRELIVSPAKGYWSSPNGHNRMLSLNCWYFMTNMPESERSPDGRYVYYIGNESDLPGKPIADTSHGVVYLKEPDAALEAIREFQNITTADGWNNFIVGDMTIINNGAQRQELERYGSLFLGTIPKRGHITAPNGLLMTEVKQPAHLAYYGIVTLSHLSDILNEYLDGKDGESLVVTDLTDLFYDSVTKGSKTQTQLKPTINSATRSMEVDAYYNIAKERSVAELTLSVGLDTPDRNTLAAIAANDPKVKLVTWRESDSAFRYATVVETKDDVGIWACCYSNLRIILP